MNNIDNNKAFHPNEIENPTKFVALSATFTALVFIATAVFQLGISATNGYFNVGESMVYLSALVGGPLVGMVSGALGSSLSDVITGYGVYARGTFIIKGLEGYVAGYLFLKIWILDKKQIQIVYSAFSSLLVVLIIFLTTPSLWNLFGNFITGNFNLSGFPGDIGSYQFSLYFTTFSPQINNLDIFNLGNFIIWNQNYTEFDISGLMLIALVLLFIILIWLMYYFYGEKSKIIFSCASS